MPIVNGTYVPETLPGVKSGQWQQQAFGDVGSNRDWSDSKQAAFNYLLKQQEQAYNLELWNLQNEYNTPQAQMARFQDAGLNPFLIYSQQNAAQAPQAASAFNFRSSGNYSKNMQNAMSMIGQIMNTVKAARETYDYMKYGKDQAYWSNIRTQEQALGQKLTNEWDDYLLHGENMIYGDAQRMVNGPRSKLYKYQTDVQNQRYLQLKALCNMIPDQQARQQALTELDKERLNILQSQTGFITNFDTGHPQFDSFFKMLAFFVMNSGT